jgi:predicted RecA/RadA family phage recombinase
MAQDYQARFIQDGKVIDYTPVSDVIAGKVVVVGAHVGITKVSIPANKLGALALTGLFDVVKVTGAINDGAAIYWDADGNPQGGTAGTGAATTTSVGNTFMGFAVGAAAETAETVRIDLIGVASVTNTIHNALTAVIADPGDGEVIAAADSGHVDIETADAETRLLAGPVSIGELLLLSLKTYGGDCTITCPTSIGQNGDNTIVMGAEGASILLVGVAVGEARCWRVVSNDGCVLSAV